MDDQMIIAKFWARDQQAIVLSEQKYGDYCHTIAYNITQNLQDSEECKNDTWLAAWHAIPPQRLRLLKVFLGKITRNLALDVYRRRRAKKRGQHPMAEILSELSETLPGEDLIDQALSYQFLVDCLEQFLESLPLLQRQVFILRYWHGYSIREISHRAGWSESHTSNVLFRLRSQLKDRLAAEEIRL